MVIIIFSKHHVFYVNLQLISEAIHFLFPKIYFRSNLEVFFFKNNLFYSNCLKIYAFRIQYQHSEDI